jgi:hypothetical protein
MIRIVKKDFKEPRRDSIRARASIELEIPVLL